MIAAISRPTHAEVGEEGEGGNSGGVCDAGRSRQRRRRIRDEGRRRRRLKLGRPTDPDAGQTKTAPRLSAAHRPHYQGELFRGAEPQKSITQQAVTPFGSLPS